MRIRDHLLSIVFAVAFFATLAGQSVAGLFQYNEEQVMHGAPTVGWGEFVTSSAFVVDVAENWQSEFLQFFLFILATVWLVQRGSPESKKPGEQGLGSDREQLVYEHAQPNSPKWAKVRGFRHQLYANSLLITIGAIFIASWGVQSLAGLVVQNDDNAQHGEAAMTWAEYLLAPDFWNRTLQNWQSELLAVGCMVGFSIYLRQRGSAESKPVGAPHTETAVEG